MLANALAVPKPAAAAGGEELIQRGLEPKGGQALKGRIVCIGGACLSQKYRARAAIIPRTSNPCEGRRGFGGVARNVAENLARLEIDVCLISATGDDDSGRALLRHLGELEVDLTYMLTIAGAATATYVAVLEPTGDMALGLADMDIFDRLTSSALEGAWPRIASADWVFADCNLPADTLAELRRRRAAGSFRLAIDAVSIPKAARLRGSLENIDVLFANYPEADAILGAAAEPADSTLLAARKLLKFGAGAVVLTDGGNGHVVATAGSASHISSIPATPRDATGAGDALIAATLYRLLAGETLDAASRTGALAAALTLESVIDVNPELTPKLLAGNATRLAQATLRKL